MKQLPAPRRRLLDLLQAIRFGCMEALWIVDREPLLEPPPRILHSVKLGGDARPDAAASADDNVLKKPLRDLFTEFGRLGSERIARLDLKDGLPCSLAIEEPPLRTDAVQLGRPERESVR